jgi:hypothetical protein
MNLGHLLSNRIEYKTNQLPGNIVQFGFIGRRLHANLRNLL